MALQFGVFDHIDDNGSSRLGELYESRLKLIELYERAGFRSYHIAEHHSTPLGMAPSPSVFLAAVAQRTKKLRFGPLLYVTPMYHPVRLAEEIVMLDHMSGGRLELGLGRGASGIEIGGYDVDPDTGPARNIEATELILKALTSDVLNHEGKFYKAKNVRVAAHPVQKPHPPLWFAPIEPERAEFAARRGANIVTLVPPPLAKSVFDAYRHEWKHLGKPERAMPLIGVSRHVVIADTDEKALAIAEAAYAGWRNNMKFLWDWAGIAFPVPFLIPPKFTDLMQMGTAVAGTPDRVRGFIEKAVAETGITYVVCDIMFGSMPVADAARTVDLLAEDVMPHFR
ncbi:MAG TPA: LLM class flavin-dependent oxidoreductase [Stellaceae bacterium]|jgi:alkanesulfonate monooxygenase SsuD/methylene tetrahydromethanopterin reductase-like flavin-dependent oxidoreductase (luciferase family)